ncbi:glycosyltransferase family 4 protein [Nitrosopumilus sp. S6]
MKILLISPTLKGIGGVAQHVRDFITYLQEHGHEVDVLSSENTPIIPLKKLKNPSFLITSYLKTKFMKKYDIVHAMHPIGAMAMKNITGKKILTIHGIFSEQIGLLHGESSSKLSSKYEQNALKFADAITAGSEESYEYYKKLNPNVFHIPNAIDIESLPVGSDSRYKNQIIFAGRLSKEKGILTILEMAKKLPEEINLLIIGSGPEEKSVLDIEKQFKNIHYLGYQPKEKTIPLIRGSILLIQPSFAEGISSTLLEAMACKTPIIATNIGGNKELLGKNNVGILIEPGSSENLLKKIVEMVSDKNLQEKICTAAYNEVQKYGWPNIGKLYVDLYKQVLNS